MNGGQIDFDGAAGNRSAFQRNEFFGRGKLYKSASMCFKDIKIYCRMRRRKRDESGSSQKKKRLLN